MEAGQPDPAETGLAERYRVLLEIARTLAATLSIEDLYRAIYRETSKVLEAAGFYISTYDEARDLATVVFYADQGEEQQVEIAYRGSASEVIRTGRPSLVRDRLQDHSLMLLGEEDSDITRSAVSAPLRYKGRIIGSISAQSYRPAAFDAGDVELLQGLADIAAVAVENARHVAELERRRLEAEQIEKIGRALTSSLDAREVLGKVNSAACELLGGDDATVWLLEGHKIKIAASTGTLAGFEGELLDLPRVAYTEFFEKKRSVVVESTRESPLIPDEIRPHIDDRGGLGVPIVVGDRAAGVLSVGFRRKHVITDEDIQLLQRLASQASVALENAELHSQLQSISLTDPLTSLPNRRHLQMHLETELAAAGRGRNLSIVLFDLDNFKTYNDTLGHVAGDQALRLVARILERETRSMHLVARYGGDEFISVQSDTSEEGARQHAERVAARISSDPSLAPFGFGVSYGIAMYTPSMRDADDLIRAADRDLYRSKAIRAGSGEGEGSGAAPAEAKPGSGRSGSPSPSPSKGAPDRTAPLSHDRFTERPEGPSGDGAG